VMAYRVGAVSYPLHMIFEDRGCRIPERLLAKLWKERAARWPMARPAWPTWVGVGQKTWL